MRRPAETSSASATAAVALAYDFGVRDPRVLFALIMLVGSTPALVSSIVDRRSRRREPPAT